eukprot:TRINITY_DN11800_c0_g1_i2.p1 TRINITY_DN11800_c0_g1~~TRINITY_DN11800_c0_g1_i2.p1  ORF type:complete len:361 (-),score=40.96 TRINITY_DN11800_c0_g1_i2:28-1110(-)
MRRRTFVWGYRVGWRLTCRQTRLRVISHPKARYSQHAKPDVEIVRTKCREGMVYWNKISAHDLEAQMEAMFATTKYGKTKFSIDPRVKTLKPRNSHRKRFLDILKTTDQLDKGIRWLYLYQFKDPMCEFVGPGTCLSLVKAAIRLDCPEKALDVFRDRKNIRTQPSYKCFAELAHAFADKGDAEQIDLVIRTMNTFGKDNGSKNSLSPYISLLQLHWDAQDIASLQSVIKSMKNNNAVANTTASIYYVLGAVAQSDAESATAAVFDLIRAKENFEEWFPKWMEMVLSSCKDPAQKLSVAEIYRQIATELPSDQSQLISSTLEATSSDSLPDDSGKESEVEQRNVDAGEETHNTKDEGETQ